MGLLEGSVRRTRDSWSRGRWVQALLGHRAYVKTKTSNTHAIRVIAISPLEDVPKRRWKFLWSSSRSVRKIFLFNINLFIICYNQIKSNRFRQTLDTAWTKCWVHTTCTLGPSPRTNLQRMPTLVPFSFPKSIIPLSCCDITYHRTLGFWEIISLSKASTKSLSYPVLSNLLVSGSVTAAGDLFYIGRKKKNRSFWLPQQLYFVSVSQTQRLDSSDIFLKS